MNLVSLWSISAIALAASSASVKACSPVHGPRALAAVMLRRQHLVAAAERLGEGAPLAGAAARAMQGYHPPAARWPRLVDDIEHSWQLRFLGRNFQYVAAELDAIDGL